MPSPTPTITVCIRVTERQALFLLDLLELAKINPPARHPGRRDPRHTAQMIHNATVKAISVARERVAQ